MNLLRVVHRWIGLTIAVLVFLVASSGGLLLMRDPYYRAIHPSLGDTVANVPAAARASRLADLETRFRHDGIRLVKFPQPGMNAFQLWFEDGSEAFVDPVTGKVIDRWQWSSDVPAFLFELHAHLLVEPAGTLVNGVAALVMVFLALTGIVLWWPRRRGAFHLRGIVPMTTTAADLLRSHAAVGAVVAVPVMLFAVTGAAIVFYDEAAAVATALLDSRAPEVPGARVVPREAPHRSWPEILSALDRTLPDGQTVFFYPGTPGNARLMFRKRVPGEWHTNGRSYVVIDPYTADVVQTIDARTQGTGTHVMHALYPIHAAKVGGTWMILLAGATSLALSWLALGGACAYLVRLTSRVYRRSYFLKLPHSSISEP